MERRVRRKVHARCETGENLAITSKGYLSSLFLYTKMRNVAGLAQTEAQKSSDLFMKCRYLDELTGGRGVVFATGTPISNSITEMYTMQRYLQYETLRKQSLQHFDCWASTFGETVTAIELAPEGTGYRAKTRFARFYNLPELMNMFKEVADIKTADLLNLPVPKANYHNVAVKPSEFQRDMVAEFAERAEKVRAKQVEPYEDNMLKITNDGRKLALDQRLANSMLPDDEASRFAHKGALVAFAGVDAPPYQSGAFEANSQRVSKRGSPHLRKTLFQICSIILQTAPFDDPVFQFMSRKRTEGKHFYVYMIAGANKFLRIYYARVKEYLNSMAAILKAHRRFAARSILVNLTCFVISHTGSQLCYAPQGKLLAMFLDF
jgi:hypothetical protein